MFKYKNRQPKDDEAKDDDATSEDVTSSAVEAGGEGENVDEVDDGGGEEPTSWKWMIAEEEEEEEEQENSKDGGEGKSTLDTQDTFVFEDETVGSSEPATAGCTKSAETTEPMVCRDSLDDTEPCTDGITVSIETGDSCTAPEEENTEAEYLSNSKRSGIKFCRNRVPGETGYVDDRRASQTDASSATDGITVSIETGDPCTAPGEENTEAEYLSQGNDYTSLDRNNSEDRSRSTENCRLKVVGDSVTSSHSAPSSPSKRSGRKFCRNRVPGETGHGDNRRAQTRGVPRGETGSGQWGDIKDETRAKTQGGARGQPINVKRGGDDIKKEPKWQI